MPLVLEVLSGKLSGKRVSFDERATKHVRVGRANEAGIWKFALNPQHRVFVGDTEAYNGMPLDDEAVVHLGGRDGPSLSLNYVRSTETNQVATVAQGRAADDHWLLAQARRNIIFVVAGVAALSLIGGYFIGGLRSSVRELQGAIAANRLTMEQQAEEQRRIVKHLEDVAEKAKGTDFSGLYDTTKSSIFYVDVVGPGNISWNGATAWVVRLKNGQKAFATNAHVAALFEKYKGDAEGRRVVARSSAPPDHRVYDIVDHRTHPAYAEFTQRLESLDKRVRQNKVRDVGMTPGYDVALLFPASEVGLPEGLTLASDAEIAALRTGDVLATLGFPTEAVASTDRMAPSPLLQSGNVTSMTSFFLMPAGANAQLILHNLPATGGASGSPIFNSAGRVVALLSGGNVTTTGDGRRTPSAALVNFAQRVDLLREVIDDKAAERLKMYRQAWDATEARVQRGAREFLEAEIVRFKDEYSGAESVGSTNGKLETASSAFKGHLATTLDLTIEAGYRYFVLAMSEGKGAKLSAILHDRAAARYLDVVEADAPVAELEFDAAKSQTTGLVIVHAAKDANGNPDQTPLDFSVAVWRAKN
jgi:Trypsin-like peptidase domain